MTATILLYVRGGVAQIKKGNKFKIAKELTFFDHKLRFTPAFRAGHITGYVSLYNAKKSTFPSGLVPHIVSKFKNVVVQYKDDRVVKFEDLDEIIVPDYHPDFELHQHQLVSIKEALRNHRGILNNCTGSGKSAAISIICKYLWVEHNIKTIIVVPQTDLLTQLHASIQGVFGRKIKVGRVGSGFMQIGPVIVATGQTLCKFKDKTQKGRDIAKLLADYGAILFDECHVSSSATWQSISAQSEAWIRIGLSGTPLTKNALTDSKIIGATGPVLKSATVKNKTLIKQGLLAKPLVSFVMDDTMYGKWVDYGDYVTNYVQNVSSNDKFSKYIALIARKLQKSGKPCLVLTPHVKHVKTIASEMDKLGIPYREYTGKNTPLQRAKVKADFMKHKNFVIIGTSVMDVGVDIPEIKSIVLAGGGKSMVTFLQRVGRGLRLKADGDDRLFVIDFAHPGNSGISQAEARLKLCVKEGFKVKVYETYKKFFMDKKTFV